MDGIDRYEAQSIADAAAQSVRDDVMREIGWELDALREDLRRARNDIDSIRQETRREIESLRMELGDLRNDLRMNRPIR